MSRLSQPDGVPRLTDTGYELFWNALFGSNQSDIKDYAVDALREYIAKLESRPWVHCTECAKFAEKFK